MNPLAPRNYRYLNCYAALNPAAGMFEFDFVYARPSSILTREEQLLMMCDGRVRVERLWHAAAAAAAAAAG